MSRISQAKLKRDVAGNAVVLAAKTSMSRYGYYEHSQVLKDAKVFVNMDSIPWDVVMACVVKDLDLKLVKVCALFFADYVYVDGKAVTPEEDAEIDPSKYLAGSRKPTAGCISASFTKFGKVVWAKVEHRRKMERGIHEGTQGYIKAIKKAEKIAAKEPAVAIEEETEDTPTWYAVRQRAARKAARAPACDRCLRG